MTMNAKHESFLIALLTAVSVLSLPQCKKDVPIAHSIPERLYISYQRGMINECWHEGHLYYSAGENAYDAATYIYDAEGKKVAQCNYFANNVDSLCQKMDSCRSIYICEDNIWGFTPLDVYGLSKK
jgi:hypothetical protein